MDDASNINVIARRSKDRRGNPVLFWIASLALAMTMMFFVIHSAYAQCAMPGQAGLVGHWPLDEGSGTTSADASGNGNDASTSGAGFTWQSGFVGSGSILPNNNGGLEIASSATIDNLETFTLSMWVNGNNASSLRHVVYKYPAFDVILNHGSSTYNFGFSAYRWGTTAGFWRTPSNSLPNSGWHHLAVTYDYSSTANNPVLYIDGVVQTVIEVNTPAGSLASDSGIMSIGYNYGGTNEIFQDVDEVRLYNRILSEGEIKGLFQQRSTSTAVAGQVVFDEQSDSIIYCNGTEWVHAGVGSYNPNAVYFDGSDYLSLTGASGPASSTQWTGSFWIRRGGTGIDNIVDRRDGSGNLDVDLDFDLSNYPNFKARNSSSTIVLNVRAAAPITDTNWHHVMFSFDLTNASNRHVYIDGVSALGTITTYNTSETMNFSAGNIGIGNIYNGSGNDLVGDLADLWVDFDSYIDLSIEENRRKFISANGMPMYLGADGSIPTGSQPDIFLSGDTANWHTNKGSGGGFTESGQLTYSSSQPGDGVTGSGTGYFVEGPMQDADFGGIAGAAATCLSTLQSSNWLGKSTAQANGQLNANYVRPWLCTTSACQNLVPGKTYTYASTLNSGAGGATITATAQGYTEDDGLLYSNATAFGSSFRTYWTGRGQDNLPEGTDTCSDWTSNSGVISSYVAVSDTGYYPEKLAKIYENCDANFEPRLICIVDPPGCYPGGKMVYDADFNVMKYCNGVEWVAMGPTGGTPPTSGLIAHWKLDEASGSSISDSAGSSTGTWTDGANNDVAEETTTGLLGAALGFSGGAQITMGDTALLDGLTAVSVCAWANPGPSIDATEPVIAKWDGASGAIMLWLDSTATYSGRTDTVSFIVGGGRVEGSTDLIKTDEWAFICGVFNNGNLSLYKNGVLDYTDTTPTTSIGNTSQELRIGAEEVLTMDGGSIDDVRIYNRVLSEGEIQQLYHYGLSGGLGDVDNGCTNPVRDEGTMLYGVDNNVLQYCNGEKWIGIGQ